MIQDFNLQVYESREIDEPQPGDLSGGSFEIEDSPGPSKTENLKIVEDSPGPYQQPVNELFLDDNGNLNTAGLDDKEKEILTEDLQAQKAGFPVPSVKTFIVLILIGLLAYLINEDLI